MLLPYRKPVPRRVFSPRRGKVVTYWHILLTRVNNVTVPWASVSRGGCRDSTWPSSSCLVDTEGKSQRDWTTRNDRRQIKMLLFTKGGSRRDDQGFSRGGCLKCRDVPAVACLRGARAGNPLGPPSRRAPSNTCVRYLRVAWYYRTLGTVFHSIERA